MVTLRFLMGAVLAAGVFGQKPCPTCDHKMERPDVLCVHSAECRNCAGTLFSGGADERRSLVRAWRDAMRKRYVEAHGGRRSPQIVRTENVELVYRVGRLKGCPVRGPHAQVHLFANRLEGARTRVLTDLGLLDGLVKATTGTRAAGQGGRVFASDRMFVHVWDDGPGHRRATRRMFAIEHQGIGTRRTDGRLEMVLQRDPKTLVDDSALHRTLVYNAVHLLLSRVEPAGSPDWVAWLGVGLAHHYEAVLTDGRCESVCFRERAQAPVAFWKGDWERAARELHAKGALPQVSDLMERRWEDFDLVDRVAALAFVRCLLEDRRVRGAGLGRMILAAKSGADPAEVLEPLGGVDQAQSTYDAFLAKERP